MNPFSNWRMSRRRLLQIGSLATAGSFAAGAVAWGDEPRATEALAEFGYGAVSMASDAQEAQLRNTQSVLMSLSDDSLLMPFRQMAGLPAPGVELGGWYAYRPDYDYRKNFDEGFAPGCHFGQWVSALARGYAITGDTAVRDKVLRLNRLYAQTISGEFYRKSRFPAYVYDKLTIGLLDSHSWANDPQALAILERTTDTALPHLPGRAVEHDQRWRMDKDPDDASWTWDESYTLPENMFLAAERGAGPRYFDLGRRYLDDEPWFDPLSRGEHVLKDRHAYSYVNSLSSAMMAYFAAGSEKHLRAARNGFTMLQAQSYATGGWGPDELLRGPGGDALYDSLRNTHAHFETPCGSYAHFKLTRYLLRATGDSRYGDSMERVMYNTVLGALPLQADGRHFYYSDYNFDARRVYKEARWACCSGSLPQVAADYRINLYLRGPRSVYVNLYVPSTLRWEEGGTQLTLTQTGNYPYDGRVVFSLAASKPADTTLHFRIPAWAPGAQIRVNGEAQPAPVPGRFAAVRRLWRSGDVVELLLPLPMRLEPIDPRHPGTVALARGPLVLMAVKPDIDAPVPALSRSALLSAGRAGAAEWRADSATGPVVLTPFTALGTRPYTAYLDLV
ncbi:MAG: beta-L-arabinofuranosidase domain-containing protein [Sphingomicrobium sp.]